MAAPGAALDGSPPGATNASRRRPKLAAVSTHPADNSEPHRELPVEELLRRARPLPSHEEMVINDLGEDEGAAFLAAVKS
jgi:hypothetical protein